MLHLTLCTWLRRNIYMSVITEYGKELHASIVENLLRMAFDHGHQRYMSLLMIMENNGIKYIIFKRVLFKFCGKLPINPFSKVEINDQMSVRGKNSYNRLKALIR